MVKNFLEAVGRYAIMLRYMMAKPQNSKVFYRLCIKEAAQMAIRPLALVVVVSFAMGMVIALQGLYMLNNPVLPKSIVGSMVREVMILELAPTGMAALLSNFIGFSTTFELGRGKLSNQIDALQVMGVNVENLLILPKLLASMIVIPSFIILSSFLGIVGGWFYGYMTGIIPTSDYLEGLRLEFKPLSIEMMLIKSMLYAFVIPTISGFKGLYFKGNIQYLGKTATRSIMYNCIIILLIDYCVTAIMLLP